MKPMLACPAPTEGIDFPVLASAKLDGIRCVIKDGQALSRKLELIPNYYIQEMLGRPEFEGFDGELIVGVPYSETVFNDTQSGVMRYDGQPDFTFNVFDFWNGDPKQWFCDRYSLLAEYTLSLNKEFPYIQLHEHYPISSMEELNAMQTDMLEMGYEGLIIRSFDGPYKFGRSTAKQAYMMKIKRFVDAEAEIIGYEEQLHNDNDAELDELGYAKRSKVKDGMVPAGMLGALKVRDCTTGVEFKIGTGFDLDQRKEFWQFKESLIGLFVKYKHFEVGVKIAPRFPVFIGFRHKMDIDNAS